VRQFEHIARVDSMMLWLNNGRLLFIVLVPFATRLMTEYEAYENEAADAEDPP